MLDGSSLVINGVQVVMGLSVTNSQPVLLLQGATNGTQPVTKLITDTDTPATDTASADGQLVSFFFLCVVGVRIWRIWRMIVNFTASAEITGGCFFL